MASIYTCQGLDFDDVGFIWWDDLVWDEQNARWRANRCASKDKAFRDADLPQEELDALFINTYYIMPSRARNKLGIWFKDPATRRHVTQVLGLRTYDPVGNDFDEPGECSAVSDLEPRQSVWKNRLTGKVTFADHTKKYAYIKGGDGEDYCVSSGTYERTADPAKVLIKGADVSFTVWAGKNGKKYANDIKPE